MNAKPNLAIASSELDEALVFQRDFETHFKNLTDAVARSQSVGALASSVGKKGTLSMVWGSLNGKNDKELAQMVNSLAGGLETTQVVLQMVLKLSHRKNGFTRQFHEVLVNKIAQLGKDSATLDSNQREATIAILEELDNHVYAQLQYQEQVEAHNSHLERLDAYVESADLAVGNLNHTVSALQNSVLKLDAATSNLDQRLAGLSADVHKQKMHAAAQQRLVEDHLTKIESDAAEQQSEIAALSFTSAEYAGRSELMEEKLAQLERLLGEQQKKNDLLETTIAHFSSAKSMLLRHAVAVLALGLAVFSVLK